MSALVAPLRAIVRTAVSLFIALAVAAGIGLVGTAAPASAAVSAPERTFLAEMNQARAEHGLAPLQRRKHLVKVARAWARTMANQASLYHNPKLTSDVRNWRWVGENVGYGPDAATVHVAFMNSPGHRANILDRDYTQVGIGTVTVDGRVWVAEVFRQPAR